MTKRPSERNKAWEKDRRDRLNKAFEELAKLLPQYDPTVTWSKIEIIQKSIAYIEDLGKKHDQLLENHDPKLLDDYKDLLDTLSFFRARNNQLAELLNKANITVPPAKFPKFITEKIQFLPAPVEIVKPRPVGRPKKNTNVENENSNKKPIIQERLPDKPDSTTVATQTDGDIPANENKIEEAAKSVSDVTTCTPVEVNAVNPTTTTVSVLQAGANAFIPTGVLIPVVTFKPAVIPPILPPVRGSALISTAANVASNSLNTKPKCEILSVQTLPSLSKVPKKVVKGKDGKVNLSPYPILKLYIRRPDNKVPIPALKREVVTVKKKRRKRKRGRAKECDTRNFKRRRKSFALPASNLPKIKTSNIDKTTPNFRHNIAYKKVDSLLNQCSKNSSKCIRLDSIESNDSTLKANHSLSLTDNDLPDEYFSSLDIPDTNPNSACISPTAAFLLSFPVVNPTIGGKNVGDVEGEICGNTEDRSDNNINEGLENLNNFFSTKEYYRYYNQACEESGKLACGRGLTGSSGLQKSAKVERHISDGKDAAAIQMLAKSKMNYTLNAIETASLTEVNDKCKGQQKSFIADGSVPPIAGKDISSSIEYFTPLENCSFDVSLNPNTKLKVSTINSSTGGRHPPIASNSGKPSNSFSVSNIFTNISSAVSSSHLQSNTTFTVAEIYSHTLPKPQTSGISFQSLNDTTKTIGMYSDVEPPPLGSIIPFFPKPASVAVTINAPSLSLINPIPTPIPVPIPQSSSFSTTYIPPTSSSYILSQSDTPAPIITSSIWTDSSVLMSKSKSNFDVNAMLPQFSSNESATQPLKLDFAFGSKNIISSISTAVSASNSVAINTQQHAIPYSNPLDSIAASSKSYFPSSGIVISNQNDSKQINQSNPMQENIISNPLKSDSVINTVSSNATTRADFSNKKAFPSISKSKLNTANPNPTSKKKTGAKTTVSPTQVEKTSIAPNAPTSSALPTVSSKFSTKYSSTSDKSYSLANTEFTFVLTGGTSTYVSTTAANGHSQPYFTYSNVNQNLQWIPCTINSDFQTPFTFSLTSTSSTSATTVAPSNAGSSNKPTASIEDNLLKKSTQVTTSTNSFNSFPDLPMSTPTYPVSSLAFATQLPNNNSNYSYSEILVPATNYCPTNFTFSLAKQQNTTTTVSSDFIKPLPSCNTIDQKYQPLYNTYGLDNYSQVYSNETTNFTFALTNPTQTSTCSKDVDNKNSQRFSGSFSIDATLGASVVDTPLASQSSTISQAYQHKSEQSVHMQSKMNPSTKFNPHQNDQMPSKASSYFNPNIEQQAKANQKSHVNWMTSCNPGDSVNSNQQISYHPSYSTSASDVNNKNNIFISSSIEDNFPAWSPSKVLDTSHLLQSSSNTYYEFNPLPPASNSASSKIPQDPVKQISKPNEIIVKDEKGYTKSSNKNNQSKFFSVSHLVEENTPNTAIPTDISSKKPKIKDARKNLNSSFEADHPSSNSYENSKPTATVSSYSAEALISKKDNRNQSGPASIHHLHNNDYYPVQNDNLNNSYFPQDTENINYNSNFFYNFIPPNQNFISDIDYLGSFPDTPSKKTDAPCNRKSLSVGNTSKDVDKKSQPSGIFNPNLTLDSSLHLPSIPPSNVPPLDPFETFQYTGNNFPNSGWNCNKIIGTAPQGSLPFVEDPNMQVCNQAVSGSSGGNITNFNLSTICPEISEKGNEPNTNNW